MLLSLQNLSLTFDEQRLLSDINLDVAAGEKIAVVGANGAGKSSLLRTIAGLHRVYSGSLTIDGEDARRLTPDVRCKLISMVPQRLEFVPRFTVFEFLEMSGSRVSDIEDAGLFPLLKRYLTELSGGELQRVVIAAAIAQRAKLLLLDEPTAHLDPTGRAEVERVIVECHMKKTTSYLLVTHDLSLAVQLAERIIVLKDGAVLADTIVTDPNLINLLCEAYGCRFSQIAHPVTGAPMIVAG